MGYKEDHEAGLAKLKKAVTDGEWKRHFNDAEARKKEAEAAKIDPLYYQIKSARKELDAILYTRIKEAVAEGKTSLTLNLDKIHATAINMYFPGVYAIYNGLVVVGTSSGELKDFEAVTVTWRK